MPATYAHSAFFYVELICNFWFIIELFIRFIVSINVVEGSFITITPHSIGTQWRIKFFPRNLMVFTWSNYGEKFMMKLRCWRCEILAWKKFFSEEIISNIFDFKSFKFKDLSSWISNNIYLSHKSMAREFLNNNQIGCNQ